MRDGTCRRRSVPCPPSCRYGCTRRRHRAKRASARIARAPGSMRVKARLQRLPGLSVSTRGHQLQLEVDPAVADVSAHGLADALLAEDPAVVLWSQLAREGTLLLTLRKASDEVADYVCERIARVLESGTGAQGVPPNIGDAIADQLELWPLSPGTARRPA